MKTNLNSFVFHGLATFQVAGSHLQGHITLRTHLTQDTSLLLVKSGMVAGFHRRVAPGRKTNILGAGSGLVEKRKPSHSAVSSFNLSKII